MTNGTRETSPAPVRHISELLSGLFQATKDPNPDEVAIHQYASRHRLPAAEIQAINDWSRAEEAGRTKTEVCTTCWAVSVTDDNSEWGLNLSTCDDCYRTVCEFCHQHLPGDDQCRCGECADRTRSERRSPALAIVS